MWCGGEHGLRRGKQRVSLGKQAERECFSLRDCDSNSKVLCRGSDSGWQRGAGEEAGWIELG